MKKKANKEFLGCIDERIAGQVDSTLAGSGILLEKNVLKNFIRENKIEVITTHNECGAALKWAREKMQI